MISRMQDFMTRQRATTIGLYAGIVAVAIGMLSFARHV